MRSTSRWTLLTVLGAVLAVPGAAHAAEKIVFMGLPPNAQKAFEKTGSDVNAFFPGSIQIRAGGTVRFAPVGFHDVDLPGAGRTTPLPLIGPTGTKVAGSSDAAGAPFWFNGLDLLGFDARLLKPGFGKSFRYRKQQVLSGLPLGPKLKPVRVRFPSAGKFTYFCNLHPGMKGTVRVLGKRKPVPSARADAKRVAAQVAAALKVAKTLLASAAKPAPNTIDVGVEGKGRVHFLGFNPATLTVPLGTTVRFISPPGSSDVHTATFGPGNPEKEPNSYLGAIAKSFQVSPTFDPRGTYPSEQPPAVASLTPDLHGNGFWNSGVLDSDDRSPVPAGNELTFGAAGTYTYYCLIHPNMVGTIAVT